MKPRAAMVVAHQDDEVLWGVGWMLERPEFDWDIICCSNYESRRQFFAMACQILGANPVQLLMPGTWSSQEPFPVVLPSLDGYYQIVTHNADGEYNNPQHKHVHSLVHEAHDNVVCFGRGALRRPLIELKLSPEQARIKDRAGQTYVRSQSPGGAPWSEMLDYFKLRPIERETYVRY